MVTLQHFIAKNTYCTRAIITRSWILTTKKVRILRKKLLNETFLALKKGVESIQTAGCNGVRTVVQLNFDEFWHIFSGHYENDIDLPKTKLLRYTVMEKQPSSHQKVASEDLKTIEKMSSDVENVIRLSGENNVSKELIAFDGKTLVHII